MLWSFSYPPFINSYFFTIADVIGLIEVTKNIPTIIRNIIDKTENAIFERCHFVEFANSSLDFELVYYIPTNDYLSAMTAQQEINLEIMKQFERENISFAYPTQTIYISK